MNAAELEKKREADRKHKEDLKTKCLELHRLPPGWTFALDPERRIYFIGPNKMTDYAHPVLGRLPQPWILEVIWDVPRERWLPVYFDGKETRTRVDPRTMSGKTFNYPNPYSTPPVLSIASGVLKRDRSLISYAREPIQNVNIRDRFRVVKTIDPGDGTVGAMNGGIFVVRMKATNRPYIEKRLQPAIMPLALKEVEMLRKLHHDSLTAYIAAFVTTNPLEGSVYLEFCDRGSLAELIIEYMKRRPPYITQNTPFPTIPEEFIWHAFLGLCDGLSYLQTGQSHLASGLQPEQENWKPILHRDIKPDNVLLKSRSDKQSKKPFYVVLSDFGLAAQEDDEFQLSKAKIGTRQFFAPEMCWNPYPENQAQKSFFPNPHSLKTDVWALGATIYCMCVHSMQGHIYPRPPPKLTHKVDILSWMEGQASRINPLVIGMPYSDHLRRSILWATKFDPKERLLALELLLDINEECQKWQALNKENRALGRMDVLPEWATRQHIYGD
jgi:serine/threonine protein kinase